MKEIKRLFENNIARLIVQINSLLLVISITDINGRGPISIYNRQPILIILLTLVLLYGIFSKSKYSIYCEVASYFTLFYLPLYRLFFEIDNFFKFNLYHFYEIEYIKFIVGVFLFLLLLVYYLKMVFDHFIFRNKVKNI